MYIFAADGTGLTSPAGLYGLYIITYSVKLIYGAVSKRS